MVNRLMLNKHTNKMLLISLVKIMNIVVSENDKRLWSLLAFIETMNRSPVMLKNLILERNGHPVFPGFKHWSNIDWLTILKEI
ncbi:unnamed protein product [Schistosoma rodhaini]|uniref:Uncharacterized protein n=1 Tax=Schistosoma rodhaini TaxID=6188 RepID=A0AA85GI22_9TREM|nr:unnamed protein product [Schistosoma rodhaini]